MRPRRITFLGYNKQGTPGLGISGIGPSLHVAILLPKFKWIGPVLLANGFKLEGFQRMSLIMLRSGITLFV